MSIAAATAILVAAGIYLTAGAVVGSAFIIAGIGRAMSEAGRVTLGARLLLLPGCVLFWPIILPRWMKGRARAAPH